MVDSMVDWMACSKVDLKGDLHRFGSDFLQMLVDEMRD